MEDILSISDRLYATEECLVRGEDFRLKDPFLYPRGDELYLVFIAERYTQNGENMQREYSVFDIWNVCVVEKTSQLYQDIVNGLPVLKNDVPINLVSGLDIPLRSVSNLDTASKGEEGNHYFDWQNAIVADITYLQMCDDELAREYVHPLQQLKKSKMPDYQAVYDFFIQNLETWADNYTHSFSGNNRRFS